MKIAVASTGYNLDSNVSPIFGRSSAFIMVNLEDHEIKELFIIENHSKNEKGAGNTAAQFISNQDINVLISGKIGPVAFHILKNAGIKIYKITPGSVEKNLKLFNKGKLKEVTSLSGGFPA
ncbi:NifB/NifX family molybdenum-iron cluster-binding protein [Methanobacterium sp.]|uniref:NifB/NifX family molybdenum-iron cluster-binding protein n=1 Tax=Methanobacterium sp. TaxID=2164 RepID=UPI003C720284